MRSAERLNRFGEAGFDWDAVVFIVVVVAIGIAIAILVPPTHFGGEYVSPKKIANLSVCEKAGVVRVLKYRQTPLTYARLSSIKSDCNDQSNRAKVQAQMRAAQS